jgi:hypothetical protein
LSALDLALASQFSVPFSPSKPSEWTEFALISVQCFHWIPARETNFAKVFRIQELRERQMESHMATTTNLGFKGSRLGLPQLVRETLSKNAMLPGLTYVYCNSVSQGERRR